MVVHNSNSIAMVLPAMSILSKSVILFGYFYRLIWESFPIKKMAFIFPISCILVLIFPIFMIYFPKCEGKGSLPKFQIKSLAIVIFGHNSHPSALSLDKQKIIFSFPSVLTCVWVLKRTVSVRWFF